MKIINLRAYYAPAFKQDVFIEVSDEVAEAFLVAKRKENAAERKMYRYKAFYSLDCQDGIENAAIGWAQPSPEDLLVKQEAEQEHQLDLIRLTEALHHLPEVQSRRIKAKYLLGMKVVAIAAVEGVCESAVRSSIQAGLKNIRKYFEKKKWEVSREWEHWND